MTKYCPEIVSEVCDYIAEGTPIGESVTFSGISQETFYSWIKEKNEFAEAVKNALGKWKVAHLKNIDRHSERNWTASAWLLERRFPEEFGQRTRLDGSISVVPYSISVQMDSEIKQIESQNNLLNNQTDLKSPVSNEGVETNPQL